MRLSWNEIRARAARFAEEWRDAHYEKGETHSFYNEFFEVFGVKRRRVASFEEPVRGLGARNPGFIDLFWKGMLLVEQKSAGNNLVQAKAQALNYFPGLTDAELPRFVLVSDFQHFELYDLEDGTERRFTLAELPRHVEDFAFIFGETVRQFKDQDPVNILASELMGKLHDALKAGGYAGHNLERFLVRLLFCLFADDTGIFGIAGTFKAYVENTRPDGTDLGALLQMLFEVLDTEEGFRQFGADDELAQFPYVNGSLFAERLPTPRFTTATRGLLLEACKFDWSTISPAIFGALFQSVMDARKRRAIGAHYTTEANILKVIGPLFLDAVQAEFARLQQRRDTGRRAALMAFHDRLASMRFLDPACGCGNFLIIAYRELRTLEIALLREIHVDMLDRLKGGAAEFNVAALSKLNVDRFYGIEVEEFPARIAEVAMWMMDHIMNVRLSAAFGVAFARIPLKVSATIRHADALEVAWDSVLDPKLCSHVLGNPPFLGAKVQSAAQRAQVHRLFAGLGRGTLDFVACWFTLAGAYVARGGGAAGIGFVATNSITQGEQVAQLWPVLLRTHRLGIAYAHRTFAWGSEARGRAHVHVVILGLAAQAALPPRRRLFEYPDINGDPVEVSVPVLSPYLFDASGLGDPTLVVAEAARPISPRPAMKIGSKPIDDGQFIFTSDERDAFLAEEPAAAAFLRPYIGSEEFINGNGRFILALHAAPPQQLRAMPAVLRRVAAVRDFRIASRSAPTNELAKTPTLYHVNVLPDAPFLVIPKVSSERRDYVPIGWLEPPTIPSDLVFIVQHATPDLFALLTSRMHMAWLRFISGRLESRYRYSIGLTYHPFPWPALDDAARRALSARGQAILAARANHAGSTLADLYDPLAMPPDLRRAHDANDRTVDQLYRAAPFASDRARVEVLMALYERETAALLASAPVRGRRRRTNPLPAGEGGAAGAG
jgi:hypothetical protein